MGSWRRRVGSAGGWHLPWLEPSRTHELLPQLPGEPGEQVVSRELSTHMRIWEVLLSSGVEGRG